MMLEVLSMIAVGIVAVGLLLYLVLHRPPKHRTRQQVDLEGPAVLMASLADQIRHARRYERPLGLVWARPPDGLAGSAGGDLTNLLTAEPLRITDWPWSDGVDLVVVAPETDRAAAAELAQRLARHSWMTTYAAFPEDALTVGALLQAVRPAAPASSNGRVPVHAPSRRTTR